MFSLDVRVPTSTPRLSVTALTNRLQPRYTRISLHIPLSPLAFRLVSATPQVSKAPRHGYMTHQTDINEKMRSILIDWLFEVHQKFKLMPETLYLTVNLVGGRY